MTDKNPSAPSLTSVEIDDLVARRAKAENIDAFTDRVLATLVAQRDRIAVLGQAVRDAYHATGTEIAGQVLTPLATARAILLAALPDLEAQKPADTIQFCERCFATMDWGIAHCFNCGAGGTGVVMLKRQAESIRESASWVGRRFYPNEEDRENWAEVKALRRAIGTYPGRSAEWVPGNDGARGYWRLSQSLDNGRVVMTMVQAPEGMKPEDVIEQHRDALPWGGPR
jgi:hypothetical protein